MVQLLDRRNRSKPRSTPSDQFLDAFANIGQGVGDYYQGEAENDAIQRLTGQNTRGLSPDLKKEFVKKFSSGSKGTDVSKNLSNLTKFLHGELKGREQEAFLNNEDLGELRKRMLPLIEAGIDPATAFEHVFGDYEQNRGSQDKGLAGLNSLMGKKKSEAANKPNQTRDFLADILTKAQQTPAKEHPMTTLEKERPGGTLGSLAIGAVAPFEEALRYQSKPAIELAEQLGFSYPHKERGELLTEKARRKLTGGLSEEAQKAAGGAEVIGAFLPVERLVSGLKLLGKGAEFFKSAEKLAAREGISVSKAAEDIARQAEKGGIDLAKVAEGSEQEAKKLLNLSERVSAEAPETATQMRIARTEPEKRIYPRTQNIKTREEQLKNFPKYMAEIEADAAKRAEQAAARVPKTDKGRMSQNIRQHEAEKALPQAQEGYYKSAARVRAIEDEIANLSASQRAAAEPMLRMAREDLKDAEFAFKQGLENLKGVNYRATAQEMKEAARQKLLSIEDAVGSGEEYKLAKMDYNPEHIKEAKRLSKNKPIPYQPKDDFYNQVHKTYIDEYRNRLGKISEEMAKLSKEHSMPSLARRQQLGKEREIVNKMIDSAEAERAIHRHKFGLRQTAERQKAKERIGMFRKVQDSPKVRAAAEEKMWKQRIKDINTHQGRAKVAEEVVEDAAREARSPAQAEKIRAEKGQLEDALDQLNKEKQKLRETLSKPIPEPKEAKKRAQNIAKDFEDMIQGLKKGGLEVFKTKMGFDIGIGVAAAIFDELKKEYDVPLSAASVLAVASGGATRRGAYRGIANQLTKWFLKNWHIERAAKAYRDHDSEKLREYSPAIKKKAKERAFG